MAQRNFSWPSDAEQRAGVEQRQPGQERALDEHARPGSPAPALRGRRAIDLREEREEHERERRRVVGERPQHGAEAVENAGGEGARAAGAELLGVEPREVVLVRQRARARTAGAGRPPPGA